MSGWIVWPRACGDGDGLATKTHPVGNGSSFDGSIDFVFAEGTEVWTSIRPLLAPEIQIKCKLILDGNILKERKTNQAW